MKRKEDSHHGASDAKPQRQSFLYCMYVWSSIDDAIHVQIILSCTQFYFFLYVHSLHFKSLLFHPPEKTFISLSD